MPTVLGSKFEDLVAIGLRVLISEDPNLELVAEGVAMESVEAEIERHGPDVVLLNFGSLGSPGQRAPAPPGPPDTRIVVLANRPTAAECNQMLSFGATACLSKETEARDIVNALHLASRGMHLLPRSAAAGGLLRAGVQGVRAADAARGRGARDARRTAPPTPRSRTSSRSGSRPCARTRATSTASSGIGSRRELSRLTRQDPIVVDGERRPVGS